jgi:16S rRNA (guanine966-N2)-methyltransferase
MSVQIIAGRAARRLLKTPPGQRTRPTQARVREAIFSMIIAHLGDLDGACALDAFAGSGALGLEAWSRGADRVWLIEAHRATSALILDNARALGALPSCEVHCGRLPTALSWLPPDACLDLVTLDPPYGSPDLPLTLSALLRPGLLQPHALLVVEHAASYALSLPPGLTLHLQRSYGETAVSLLTLASAPPSPSL